MADEPATRFSVPLLHILLASVTDGIAILDEDGRIQLFNAGCEKLFGYSAAEAQSLNFKILVPQPGRVRAGHRQFVGARREVIARRKDKSSFHLCLSVNEGERNGERIFVAVTNDLTDHKLDQAVRKDAHRLQAMLDGVTDAYVTVDLSGHVESFSQTACALFGYRASEVVGQPVTMLMPSPYSEEPGNHLQRLRANGTPDTVNSGRVVIGRKQDGSAFPMEITIGEAADGDHRLFIGFIRDITGRAGTEQRLEQLQAELLRVSRLDAMSQMTLAIAHELNQPLAAIANYVNAVKRGLDATTLTPEMVRSAHQMIGKASAQTLRAAAILKSLRGFVEKRPLTRETADLGQVVEEALALAFVSAASAGVKVTLNLDRSLPAVVIDRVQIQQVLFNLIRNSLEAMHDVDQRELTLTTCRGQDNFAEVTVEDTGPGLDPGIPNQLFKPFVTSKNSGMGVGLTICQSIVESHGGRIWLAQTCPTGATFRFSLPLPAAGGNRR